MEAGRQNLLETEASLGYRLYVAVITLIRAHEVVVENGKRVVKRSRVTHERRFVDSPSRLMSSEGRLT